MLLKDVSQLWKVVQKLWKFMYLTFQSCQTLTTFATWQLCKVAKVAQSSTGRFPDVRRWRCLERWHYKKARSSCRRTHQGSTRMDTCMWFCTLLSLRGWGINLSKIIFCLDIRLMRRGMMPLWSVVLWSLILRSLPWGIQPKTIHIGSTSGKCPLQLWATFATLQSCKVAKVARVQQLWKVMYLNFQSCWTTFQS